MAQYLIDLHTHTYYSDGGDSPYELIDKASLAGLKVLAITDHDHFTYTKDLANYAKSKGIELISGLELSCMDETTKRKVHLLAYQLSENHPHVQKLIDDFKCHATIQRLKMLDEVKQISKKDVQKYVHGMLYKQHIAKAMEEKGMGDYATLYHDYFRGKGPFEQKYPTTFIDIHDAIQAVLLDGGIPVLAHPTSYNSYDQIEKYLSWGLKGIEISHPSYKEGDLEKVLKYNVIYTGGSDYHGANNLSAKRQLGAYGIEEYLLQKLKGDK